ncbi:MAG TPA: S9 family peptidase [Longimicrobiaceae bacterium]|nr:S9 family peptidase [Longimicrobiaceae bacterium]
MRPPLRAGSVLLALLAAAPLLAQAPARRPLRVGDLYRVREVRDPQRSPEGKWVAYTVTTSDSARDRDDTDVWMASWDGRQNLRLTSTPESESAPRWSPDGRYLAFLSSRQGASGGQVWLLDRRGGEAVRLTDVRGGVSDYAWSPDGTRLVLVATDPDPNAALGDSARNRTPRPIVVDRYHFKQDVQGYLGARRSHLYLFDVASKRVDTLTSGGYDERLPSWAPDGRRIAFVSERTEDPDRTNDTNLYVVEARPGATPRPLTTFPGPDGGRPAWSPDGRTVAYLQGSEPRLSAYNLNRLAVVPAAGGPARVLTEALDRAVSSPVWSRDGRTLTVLVEDDRTQHVVRVDARSGRVERVTEGRRVVSALSAGPDGHLAVLAATAVELPEVHALEGGRLRPLSRQNEEWLAGVQLGTTEDVEFRSPDGTEVHGLLVKPAGYVAGRRYPMLLRIHGGPNSQDQHAFHFERELFAADGYVVVAVNYRGSSGRGAAFQTSIYGDWGNREVVDLLAATDQVVAAGIADPERLGIGGWSYGGILTNYTIATDPRFKTAISGAGSALQLSMYGTDQYTFQYDTEIGPPWKNREAWIRISYPFFHADRIRTPTLFMVGEKDFNVPASGSEQMYQALRSLGVPTQLVIYPGQYHGITTPSYRRDRLERYLAWYGKYLKETGATAASAGGR